MRAEYRFKVLMPFAGDTIGGSYLSAVSLIMALQEDKNQSVDVVVHQKGLLSGFLEQKKIAYTVVNWPVFQLMTKKISYFLFGTIRAFYFLIRNRYDFVHVHDGRMAWSWTLAAYLSKTPIIIHQRTKFSPSKMTQRLYKLGTKIITISEYVKESLPAALQTKAITINNPVDFKGSNKEEARHSLKQDFLYGESAFVMGFVGTLQKQKRPLLAVHILEQLREKGYNLQGVFFGRNDTQYGHKVRAVVGENGLEKVCHFTGFVKLEDYLAGCDFLLAPAVDEGFGRALIEAVSVNLPIIASRSGGHSEVFDKEAGITFFTPDNPEEAIEAIERLLCKDRVTNKKQSEKEQFLQRYSQHDHCEQVFQLYQSVVRK